MNPQLRCFCQVQLHSSAALESFSLASSVSSISGAMQAAGVTRGFVVTDERSGQPVASHPVLEPIASFLASDQVDYDKHEAIFFGVSPSTGDLMSAFLWKTKRGQGCGGIRLRSYGSVEEYIRDGLRLAIGMGRKSSLAGLYWGGGKGIIPSASDTGNPRRRQLLEDYGDFLSSLRGCYVAAEDVGITVDDVDVVFSRSRFVIGISPSLGGCGNPSMWTALGVKVAMDSALNTLAQTTLERKTVAIQVRCWRAPGRLVFVHNYLVTGSGECGECARWIPSRRRRGEDHWQRRVRG